MPKKEIIEYPVIVVAVDPGGTTGVCVMEFQEGAVEVLETHQFPDSNSVWREIQEIAQRFDTGSNRVVIVVEQFDKRPGVVNPDFTPKYVCRDIENNIHDFEIVWQIPAQAMTLVRPPSKNYHGPDQLKRFGWYKTSSVHSNDATRHAIVYGVETLKHRPLILRGWPKPEGN